MKYLILFIAIVVTCYNMRAIKSSDKGNTEIIASLVSFALTAVLWTYFYYLIQ